MPVPLGVHTIHLLPEQRAVDPRHWFLILCGGHCVRELIQPLLVLGPVGAVEAPGPGGLRLRQALALVLLSPGGMVPLLTVWGPHGAWLELATAHDWSAGVLPIVLLAPLRVLPVPLVPPFLSAENNYIMTKVVQAEKGKL